MGKYSISLIYLLFFSAWNETNIAVQQGSILLDKIVSSSECYIYKMQSQKIQ